MYDRLKAMWKPEGRMRMVDLDNEVFLAHFDNPEDYDHALTGGPWMILDHYLVCHSWDPSFRVSSDLPARMVVWVRFPKLPYQYYQSDVLKGLGNLVGRTVRIDKRTLTSARGKFAHLAVEVNLKEAVAIGVFLDNVWQDVEYENLPALCFGCGRIGHEIADCPSKTGGSSSSSMPDHDTHDTVDGRPTPSAAGGSLPEYGSWLTVQRKTWRPKNKETPKIIPPPTITTATRKGKDRGQSDKRKDTERHPAIISSQSLIIGKADGSKLSGNIPCELAGKWKKGSSNASQMETSQQLITSNLPLAANEAQSKDQAQTISALQSSPSVISPTVTTSNSKLPLGHVHIGPIYSQNSKPTDPIPSPTPDYFPQPIIVDVTPVAPATEISILNNTSSPFSIVPVIASLPADAIKGSEPAFASSSCLSDSISTLEIQTEKGTNAQPCPKTASSLVQRLKGKGLRSSSEAQPSFPMCGVAATSNKPETKLDKKKKARKLTQVLPLEGVHISKTTKGVSSYTSSAIKTALFGDQEPTPQSGFDLNEMNDVDASDHDLHASANQSLPTATHLVES
ncbi:hypothetical protein LINGRAHAP2_LOCUS10241 [Linum grandiflorum]